MHLRYKEDECRFVLHEELFHLYQGSDQWPDCAAGYVLDKGRNESFLIAMDSEFVTVVASFDRTTVSWETLAQLGSMHNFVQEFLVLFTAHETFHPNREAHVLDEAVTNAIIHTAIAVMVDKVCSILFPPEQTLLAGARLRESGRREPTKARHHDALFHSILDALDGQTPILTTRSYKN